MIAHTIANPHDRTEGTAIAIEMTNIVTTTTEGTRRLRNPLRIAKVVTMLTMSKRVRPRLVTVPVTAARNHPSGKSKRFTSDPPHTTDPEAVPHTDRKKITTFSPETPRRRMSRVPANGEGNPPPKKMSSHLLNPIAMTVGAGKIPQKRLSHLPEKHQTILMPCWQHAAPTHSSCHITTDTGTFLQAGTLRFHENHAK